MAIYKLGGFKLRKDLFDKDKNNVRRKEMNEQKNIIGIVSVNKNSVIGPVIYVLVVVKNNFFRNFSWLNIKDPERMPASEINRIVERTRKFLLDYRMISIPASDVKFNDDARAFIELINTQPKFWQHEIYIELDSIMKDFEKNILEAAPKNLNPRYLDDIEKWMQHDKVIDLAKLFAAYEKNKEMSGIRVVWGELGSGNKSDPLTIKFIEGSKDCPHIRR